jgi:transposase
MKKIEIPKHVVQDFAGIDVSAHELEVAMRRGIDNPLTIATFPNRPAGHKALLRFLLQGKAPVRVCVEASGNYSLDLALNLQAHPQVEISVVNPRRARRFAESLGKRNKTDRVDAQVLCEYAWRMPWVPWQPPSAVALHLRAVRWVEAVRRELDPHCRRCLRVTFKKRERFSCTSPERKNLNCKRESIMIAVRLLSLELVGWSAPPTLLGN